MWQRPEVSSDRQPARNQGPQTGSLQETERCQQVSLKAPELSLREQLSPGQNLNFGFTRGHAKPSEDF